MNDSQGCGGVMRMAPVGMYFAASHVRDHNSDRLRSNIFATGSELAALTQDIPAGGSTPGGSPAMSGRGLVANCSRPPFPQRMKRYPNLRLTKKAWSAS